MKAIATISNRNVPHPCVSRMGKRHRPVTHHAEHNTGCDRCTLTREIRHLIVGVSGYFVGQNKQVLSTADAGNLITATLKAQAPAVVRFHTGLAKASRRGLLTTVCWTRLAGCVWVRQMGTHDAAYADCAR